MIPGHDEGRPGQDGRSSSRLTSRSHGDTDAARRHVAAVLARCPEAAAYDVDVWLAAIEQHLRPLPANRPARVLAARRRMQPVRELAPAVARRLRPEAGHQPQPRCSLQCFATHADDQEVA